MKKIKTIIHGLILTVLIVFSAFSKDRPDRMKLNVVSPHSDYLILFEASRWVAKRSRKIKTVDRKWSMKQDCLSCHDGAIGRDVFSYFLFEKGYEQMNGGSKRSAVNRTINHDHPVGVDYYSAYLRDPRHYVAPEMLNSEILLQDGKVTCVSCHRADGTVRIDGNAKSRLCLACHKK